MNLFIDEQKIYLIFGFQNVFKNFKKITTLSGQNMTFFQKFFIFSKSGIFQTMILLNQNLLCFLKFCNFQHLVHCLPPNRYAFLVTFIFHQIVTILSVGFFESYYWPIWNAWKTPFWKVHLSYLSHKVQVYEVLVDKTWLRLTKIHKNSKMCVFF